jgi:hypothetical protein
MGIRRRRKKLTTIINSVDRRLRSVEYRSIPTRIKAASITPADIVPGTIPSDDPKDNGGTGAVASDTSPSEFAVITAAAYSSRNITGTVDRVDITTAADHGLSVGEKVTIYGLNNNDVNLDGTYLITEVPTATTLRFSRGLTGYYQSVINLIVQGTVTSRFCSTTTATLTLNTSSHGFVIGDVITVASVPDDNFFNGTFKVTAVNGANISYEFASTQTAVSITSSTGSIKSVLHKYAIIGDTWIDTSVTPNVYKIWDGLQWQSGTSLPDGIIVNDNMAPKAPTNLSATTNGYYDPSTGAPNVAVSLSWDAPTENADSTTLTDLGGYRVYYRYLNESVDGTENGSVGVDPAGYTTTPGSPASSDATLSGSFSWNNTFTSTVPAIGLTTTTGTLNVTVISAVKGSKTVLWTVSGLADGDSVTVAWTSSSSNKYGAGSVSTTLGTKEYTYSSTPATTGFSISGSVKASSETRSTTPATPEINVAIPTTTEAAPSAQWINGGDTEQTSMSLRDFRVSSTIEFAVKAVDSSKLNFSEYSSSLTIETGSPAAVLNPPSAPSMEARLGTLTITWDGYDSEGTQPPPQLAYVEVHVGTSSSFTPSSSTLKGRMEKLGGNYLIIGDLTYGTTYYSKLVFISTTGASTTPSSASSGVQVVSLVNTDLIANTLTTWPFAGKVVSAGSLADGSINASTLFGPNVVTQDAISANAIGANQIAAGSIIAGKIGANAITANEISANTITAGMIKANEITADQIKAGALDAFLITGAQIQTAKPYGQVGGQNARITLNSTGLVAYNASNVATFTLDAATGAVTIGSYDASISTANTTANSANTVATTANTLATTANNSAAGIKTAIYYPGTTQINGGSIRTGTLSADTITTGTLSGDRIYGGTITGSTITGGSLSTSGSTNISISGTNISFNYNGSSAGSIYGSTKSGSGGATVGIIFSAALTAVLGEFGVYDSTINLGNSRLYSANYGTLIEANGAVSFNTAYFDDLVDMPWIGPSTSSANVRWGLNAPYGRLYGIGSARKLKLDIQDLEVGLKALNLTPRTWIDKGEYNNNGDSATGLRRIPGFVAEEVLEAGLDDFVQYEASGEIQSISYDRLTAALIPVLKFHNEKIADLEARIELIEKR